MNLLIGADSQLGKNFKLVLKKTVFLNKKQFNIKYEKNSTNLVYSFFIYPYKS